MESKRVICIGAYPALQRTICFQTFVTGKVNRSDNVLSDVAGKAVNAARVVRTLGGSPLLAGFSGGATGELIEEHLSRVGIDWSGLLSVSAPVRICQTILPADASEFTELVEEGPRVKISDWKALEERCCELFHTHEGAYAILAGTMPPHASLEFYPNLISAHRGFTLLDTSGDALLSAVGAKPDLVKINAEELQRTLSEKVSSDEGIFSLMHSLRHQGAKSVGITQGGGGAFLLSGARLLRYSIPQVEVVSALGSGDSVNAGTITALMRGDDLEDAFAYGLACGTANAETPSPGVISADRVDLLVRSIKVSQV